MSSSFPLYLIPFFHSIERAFFHQVVILAKVSPHHEINARLNTQKHKHTLWAVTLFLRVSLQDDHKLTLDELNRKYGTDLNNVSGGLVNVYFDDLVKACHRLYK